MAVVTLIDEKKSLSDENAIRECLSTFGIDYERWTPAYDVSSYASTEDILTAYAKEIDQLLQPR